MSVMLMNDVRGETNLLALLFWVCGMFICTVSSREMHAPLCVLQVVEVQRKSARKLTTLSSIFHNLSVVIKNGNKFGCNYCHMR